MVDKRLTYIDWAKGIGMFFIMLGHVNRIDNPLITYGDTFKIVIFYIISGYLFSLKEEIVTDSHFLNLLKRN